MSEYVVIAYAAHYSSADKANEDGEEYPYGIPE